TASPNVMDKDNGVINTQLPATVDHLLTTTLHFRVVTLHRGKIQIGVTGTRVHRGGSAPTQTNQHGRATQYDQLGSNRNLPFLNVGLPDVTHPTGKYDWLVVAAPFFAIRTCYFFLKGPEISAQVGTTEFVIECSRSEERRVGKDRKC